MLSARRLLYASGQAGRHSGQDRRTRPRGEVSLLSSEVHAARAPRDISFKPASRSFYVSEVWARGGLWLPPHQGG